MLFIDFLAVFWVLVGLTCTLSPRLPGTLMIYGGAMIYGFLTDFSTFEYWTSWTLFGFMVAAEVGGRLLRKYLTKGFSLSPAFSSNTTVGNVGGMIVSDALLGMLGLFLWQLVAGKNLLPRWDIIGRVLLRSSAVAMLRFLCGLAMTIIFMVSVLF